MRNIYEYMDEHPMMTLVLAFMVLATITSVVRAICGYGG